MLVQELVHGLTWTHRGRGQSWRRFLCIHFGLPDKFLVHCSFSCIWEVLGWSLGLDMFRGIYKQPQANGVTGPPPELGTAQQFTQLRSLLFNYFENQKNYGKIVPDIKHVFHFILQILFQIFFSPINI
jgi:hypothetical protein